jgi:hypothetical protein
MTTKNSTLRKNIVTGLITLTALGSTVQTVEARGHGGSRQTDYYHVHTIRNPQHLFIYDHGRYTNHEPFIGGHNHKGKDGIFNRPSASELESSRRAIMEAEHTCTYEIKTWILPNTTNGLSEIRRGQKFQFIVDELRSTAYSNKVYETTILEVNPKNDGTSDLTLDLDFKDFPELKLQKVSPRIYIPQDHRRGRRR